ncbi:MAG: tetratricopeptide repeat protein [Bacteroidota bacterium]|nr:tetratricopeptide repeat protein [Bacteroidota bacterium]
MAKIRKSTRTNRVETGRGTELLENPEAITESFSKTEDFIKTNRTLVFSIGGLIALAIAGVFIYKMYMNNQNKEAQLEMYQAVYYFESDSLSRALNGDGNNYGFLEIVDRYGRTEAGNLARFYIAVSYLKLGEFENAIDYLNDFSSSDLLIQARAYALIGDANMELNNFSEAAKYYERAADHRSNKFFSPQYLMKAAISYEKLNDFNKAIQVYDRILENYHDTDEVQDARKHKARLEGLAAK